MPPPPPNAGSPGGGGGGGPDRAAGGGGGGGGGKGIWISFKELRAHPGKTNKKNKTISRRPQKRGEDGSGRSARVRTLVPMSVARRARSMTHPTILVSDDESWS